MDLKVDQAHRAIEQTELAKQMESGAISREAYARYLRCSMYVWRKLEARFDLAWKLGVTGRLSDDLEYPDLVANDVLQEVRDVVVVEAVGDIEARVADARDMHRDDDPIRQIDRFSVFAFGLCDQKEQAVIAEFHELFKEKPGTGRFEVGEVRCVVDVTISVNVGKADFHLHVMSRGRFHLVASFGSGDFVARGLAGGS